MLEEVDAESPADCFQFVLYDNSTAVVLNSTFFALVCLEEPPCSESTEVLIGFTAVQELALSAAFGTYIAR